MTAHFAPVLDLLDLGTDEQAQVGDEVGQVDADVAPAHLAASHWVRHKVCEAHEAVREADHREFVHRLDPDGRPRL